MNNEYGNTFDGEDQKTTNMVDALNDFCNHQNILFFCVHPLDDCFQFSYVLMVVVECK